MKAACRESKSLCSRKMHENLNILSVFYFSWILSNRKTITLLLQGGSSARLMWWTSWPIATLWWCTTGGGGCLGKGVRGHSCVKWLLVSITVRKAADPQSKFYTTHFMKSIWPITMIIPGWTGQVSFHFQQLHITDSNKTVK